MQLMFTYDYFLHDLIDLLDIKYYEYLPKNFDKKFLYANFINIPKIYKYSNLFAKDNFNLSEILNKKYKIFIKNTIQYIKEHHYQSDNVLLLYAIVSHYILNSFLDSYIDDLAKKIDSKEKNLIKNKKTVMKAIDFYFIKNKEGKVLKQMLKNHYDFEFSINNLDMIDMVVKKTYFFSYAKDIYKESSLALKSYMRHYIKKSLGSKKKKAIIEDYFAQENQSTDITLLKLYNQAKEKGFKTLEAVNSYLYLNDDKYFNLIFENI